MMLVLFLPNGEAHIQSYSVGNHSFYTLCGKTIEKNSIYNSISVDNTFDGMCSACKNEYDMMYNDDLNVALDMARGAHYYKLKNSLIYNRQGLLGPEQDYSDVSDRYWYRLRKYQRLIPKTKSKIKSNKSKYKFFRK